MVQINLVTGTGIFFSTSESLWGRGVDRGGPRKTSQKLNVRQPFVSLSEMGCEFRPGK